jgi:hypothetical protein
VSRSSARTRRACSWWVASNARALIVAGGVAEHDPADHPPPAAMNWSLLNCPVTAAMAVSC